MNGYNDIYWGYWGTPYIFPWITYYYTDDFYDDADVTDFVIDNLDADPYISNKTVDNISVDVNDGVVTLTGKAKNRKEKAHAYWDAYWTTGVYDVINELEVKQNKSRQGTQKQQVQSQSRTRNR